MSLYYFDVFDGRFHPDEKGRDLSDFSQVDKEVRRTLADLVTQSPEPVSAILTVRGGDRKTVLTASISMHFNRPDTRH